MLGVLGPSEGLGPSGDVGGIRGALGSWQGVYVLRGQQGYRWHHGAPRGVYGVSGVLGTVGGWVAVRGCRGALGAGRGYRYWGASRYRWHQGAPRGVGVLGRCWGSSGSVRGTLGACRECTYSGASMGIGGIGGS